MGMSLKHRCVYCLLRFLPMLACELAAIRSTDRKHSCDGLKTGLVGGTLAERHLFLSTYQTECESV